MIWVIGYILTVPVCAYLMLVLTANWFRSVHRNPDLDIVNILYDAEYGIDIKRCIVIAMFPCVNLTVLTLYFIIQLLSANIEVSTPIDKLFKRLYRSKYLLNSVSEEI